MLIRLMDIDDLERILELENSLFTSPWTRQDFLYEMFENDFSYNYVLEDEGYIVGYVSLWIMYEQAQIATIGIDSSYQNRGLGTLLLSAMIDEAKHKNVSSMSLEVRISNESAIALYEKCGFKKVSVRKNYYQDNFEDAYVMVNMMEV